MSAVITWTTNIGDKYGIGAAPTATAFGMRKGTAKYEFRWIGAIEFLATNAQQ